MSICSAPRILLAAAALAAATTLAPQQASAGGYGYDSGGEDYQPPYQPRYQQEESYQHCYYKRIRVYDDYYGRYVYKRVRTCE